MNISQLLSLTPFAFILAWAPWPAAVAQTLEMQPAASTVTWTGAKITGAHTGEVRLKAGTITLNEGLLGAADMVVDMTAITCTDIQNEGSNARLVNHLRSPDFFDVENHPEAVFRTTQVTLADGDHHQVTGDLTIKGITHPAMFQCRIVESEEGVRAIGSLVFDRTKYDIRYRSGSFFEELGDRMILDEVKLTFDVFAK